MEEVPDGSSWKAHRRRDLWSHLIWSLFYGTKKTTRKPPQLALCVEVEDPSSAPLFMQQALGPLSPLPMPTGNNLEGDQEQDQVYHSHDEPGTCSQCLLNQSVRWKRLHRLRGTAGHWTVGAEDIRLWGTENFRLWGTKDLGLYRAQAACSVVTCQ